MRCSRAASSLVGPVTQPACNNLARSGSVVRMMAGVRGYFANRDVLLIERSEEAVAAFHEKERIRWDEVYDEVYVEGQYGELEYYPGDRVKVVGDVSVKEIENAFGMLGVVTHYEFDDGYESCQTCSTSCPVTVLLDEVENAG